MELVNTFLYKEKTKVIQCVCGGGGNFYKYGLDSMHSFARTGHEEEEEEEKDEGGGVWEQRHQDWLDC